jgi:hypothetical protein
MTNNNMQDPLRSSCVPAVAARMILTSEVSNLPIHTAGWEVVRRCFRGDMAIRTKRRQ